MSFTNNDLAKVDLRWQVGSIGMACNVFMAQLAQETPHAVADLTVVTALGLWMTAILEPMETHIVVDCDILDCNVYKKVGPLWNLVGPAVVTFSPTSGSDPLPSGVAGLLTAYTAVSKVIGKKYLPGLSETSQTAGLWVIGVLAAMLQSGMAWIAPFNLDPPSEGRMYPGVWSLKQGTHIGFAGIAVRDVPAYQRRRKQGVGV